MSKSNTKTKHNTKKFASGIARYVPPPPRGHEEMMEVYRAMTCQAVGQINVRGQDLVVYNIAKTDSFALAPQPAGSDVQTLISCVPSISTDNVRVRLPKGQEIQVADPSEMDLVGNYNVSAGAGVSLFGDSPHSSGPYAGDLEGPSMSLTAPVLLSTPTSHEVLDPVAAPFASKLVVYNFKVNQASNVDVTIKIVARDGFFPVGTRIGLSGYDEFGNVVWGTSSVPLATAKQVFNLNYSAVIPVTTRYLGFELDNSKIGISETWNCFLDRLELKLVFPTGGDVTVEQQTLLVGFDDKDVQDLRNVVGNNDIALLGCAAWVVGDPTLEQRGRIYAGTGLRSQTQKDFMTKSDMTLTLPDGDRGNFHVDLGSIVISTPRDRAAYGLGRKIGKTYESWCTSYFALTSGGTNDMHVVVQFGMCVAAVPTNAWLPKPDRVRYMGEGVDCLFHFLSDWSPVFENDSHMAEFKKRFRRAIKRVPGYAEKASTVLARASPLLSTLALAL